MSAQFQQALLLESILHATLAQMSDESVKHLLKNETDYLTQI